MPADVKKVTTEGITRVLIKGDGWVNVRKNTFNVVSLEYYKFEEGQEETDQFTGLTYRAYIFVNDETGKLLCVAPDGLSAIEIDEGGD